MSPIRTSEFTVIRARQQAWARRTGRTYNSDGYCIRVDDNIFRGLSQSARNDFEKGDGTELGKNGRRGKIQALHSSSALACNWFEYWRQRDLASLSRTFDVPSPVSKLELECKLSTGLGGIGPNLDVVLWSSGAPFAIESKFTEPYVNSKSKTLLKSKYFDDRRGLWTKVGLPNCQAVAERLCTGEHNFKVLDVAQLLKHILALAHNSAPKWSLCCLGSKYLDLPPNGIEANLQTSPHNSGRRCALLSAYLSGVIYTHSAFRRTR